jgi:hypothetical protein
VEVFVLSWNLTHRLTNEIYSSSFSRLVRSDFQQLQGWTRGLNWRDYLKMNSEFSAYKLTIDGSNYIQGLIALSKQEGYVEIALAEKSPNNRNPINEFQNVGEVLFGFASKYSFDSGCEGFVILYAKTVLIKHYIEKYQMEVINLRERKLLLTPVEGHRLVTLYYT